MEQIDRHSITPLYYQLAQLLREQIHSGKLESGHLIPSERELMENYHLSRNTVRQALDMLAKEGLITRSHGHGTYVSNLSNTFHYMLDTFLENRDLLHSAGYASTVQHVSTQTVATPLADATSLLRLGCFAIGINNASDL
jgi:DNA-binding GntR family transcriptional regulator